MQKRYDSLTLAYLNGTSRSILPTLKLLYRWRLDEMSSILLRQFSRFAWILSALPEMIIQKWSFSKRWKSFREFGGNITSSCANVYKFCQVISWCFIITYNWSALHTLTVHLHSDQKMLGLLSLALIGKKAWVNDEGINLIGLIERSYIMTKQSQSSRISIAFFIA